jgi:hypothetical protein
MACCGGGGLLMRVGIISIVCGGCSHSMLVLLCLPGNTADLFGVANALLLCCLQDVTAVVDTCHQAGISAKAIKLRPIAVVKG